MPGIADLVKAVGQKTGMTQADVMRVSEEVFNTIPEITNTGPLTIRGFGTFKIVTRKEHMGRNPKLGIPIVVPEKSKLTFKVTKKGG